jgi:hypothetical protein
MTTPAADGKMVVNVLYHNAAGLAMGYSRLGKMFIGGAAPKLDFTPRDIGLVVVEVGLGLATKDPLIKQGILPEDIMK